MKMPRLHRQLRKLRAQAGDLASNLRMTRFGLIRASIRGRGAISLLFLLLTAAVALLTAAAQQKVEREDAGQKIGASAINDPELGSGFQLLYQLKFEQARELFANWEQRHPVQPIGPALEAASALYEEFYRKGVLTSDFFLDDKRLLGGIKDEPDAGLERQFASAAQRAEKLARDRLQNRPNDADALFALTLVDGMRADDFFLIQKRQLDSLHYLREADRNARILLKTAPDLDDAYVALGAANYIIGCLPGYKRAALWFGGVHGDKTLGMQQLARAAASDHAHYLRPYARLMLALAALREKDPDVARQQLQNLTMEFPENHVFATELAKITPVISGASSHETP
jgi:hypothetical protein